MTVGGQSIFVQTGFRGRSSIPAEAAVIEREHVVAGCVERFQVPAYTTVNGATAGRAEQDPVRRRPLVSQGKDIQADAVRRPELDKILIRGWQPASRAARLKYQGCDSFVQRHATEPDHIMTAISARTRLGRSARRRGGCASKMKGRVLKASTQSALSCSVVTSVGSSSSKLRLVSRACRARRMLSAPAVAPKMSASTSAACGLASEMRRTMLPGRM